jgi:hypothetical protein
LNRVANGINIYQPFNNEQNTNWPLLLPEETILFLSRIIAKRQQILIQSKKEDSISILIWDSFLSSLRNLLLNPYCNINFEQQGELINWQHIYFLLFIFHTFHQKTKSRLLGKIIEIAFEVQSSLKSHFVNRIFLLTTTRLILLIECILYIYTIYYYYYYYYYFNLI